MYPFTAANDIHPVPLLSFPQIHLAQFQWLIEGDMDPAAMALEADTQAAEEAGIMDPAV